jgi:hypothetical protein
MGSACVTEKLWSACAGVRDGAAPRRVIWGREQRTGKLRGLRHGEVWRNGEGHEIILGGRGDRGGSGSNSSVLLRKEV